jgi:DNA-binding protein YbaB
MMNPFGQIGELKKMREQAMQIQKELQAEEIEIEKHGVTVIITGDQKLKSINSNGKDDNDIRDAVNDAIKKSQEVAAKKLQSMTGGLGGLLGGMGK